MSKKSAEKPTPTKRTGKKVMIEGEEVEIPYRVANKILYEKLLLMEKRLMRMEKLIMMSLDDSYLKRDEKARVDLIESMIAEGRIDELEEFMRENRV
ncbi:MAG: hypothetical protein INQ03_20890 [Candidatus Heimdallarchaeota archaeon]|nr:hypothetical protein [Candidatus Heimdallarchaeota archaeon]